jgi:UrcA family protein
MTKFAIAAALAAAASLLPAAPAAAEEFTVRISYADLDLATAAGTEQLGKRIEVAAEEACGRPFIRDLSAIASFERCKGKAVEGAVKQLDAKGIEIAAL